MPSKMLELSRAAKKQIVAFEMLEEDGASLEMIDMLQDWAM